MKIVLRTVKNPLNFLAFYIGGHKTKFNISLVKTRPSVLPHCDVFNSEGVYLLGRGRRVQWRNGLIT